MTTRVLAPIDGSDTTYRALERGLSRIKGPMEVTCIVVMDAKILAMPKDAREHLEWDDEDEIFLRDDEAQDALSRAAKIVANFKGAKAKTAVLKGDVVQAVIDASSDHGVLIMHALRSNESEDRARRSRTEDIARKAKCDVLLVHAGDFE